MALIEFNYNNILTIIQCNEDHKMIDKCNSFISKTRLNEKDIYYIYDDIDGSEFDKNKTFKELANSMDQQRKK